ncbi:MAG: Glyoxalase/Bleomycin resistance protein/Dioxygenase superfamily [Glaciihabitans sp.]|nr:Glyoxalase/Bleomycin resistance protein/Dioxygenase superfamily [Glaciihabitans sp.]
MLTLGSVVMGVNDVARATKFWMAALDYEPTAPGDDTWIILRSKSGTGQRISLALGETPVQEHPRIHLDLYAFDQAAEVERLIGLGATDVNWDLYPDDADFVVLADTEGNRFCVIAAAEYFDGTDAAAGTL